MKTGFLVLGLLALLQAKPNVLFIMIDDQSFETIAALGDPQVQTPHLDGLARSGTAFTHAYNMGSWGVAVCIASRTMLMTGRFLWDAERTDLRAEQNQRRLWPQLMKKAGYTTYMTGKWHVNPLDPRDLFDVVRKDRIGMAAYSPTGIYDWPPKPRSNYFGRPEEGTEATLYDKPNWRPFDTTLGGHWQGGRHWAEVCADEAIGFIRTAAQRPEPFFMYVAFNSVHHPRQAPREYLDLYPQESFSLPAAYRPLFMPDTLDLMKMDMWRDKNEEGQAPLAPSPRTPFAVKTHRTEYYAMVSHLDAQIGRILAALDSSGKRDSTFIIYTADNGLAIGNHGLMGKENMHDPSMRVPFIVAGPGILRQTSATRIYAQDAMPTVLEWAGIPKPEAVDFRSLLPLLRGDTRAHYDAIYGNMGEGRQQKMIVKGGYKLIYYPPLNRAALFNLKDDPSELKDLSNSPGHAAVIDTLWKSLLALEGGLRQPIAYGYQPPAAVGPQVGLGEWIGETVRIRKAVHLFRNHPVLPGSYEVFSLTGRSLDRRGSTRAGGRRKGPGHSGEAAGPGLYFVR